MATEAAELEWEIDKEGVVYATGNYLEFDIELNNELNVYEGNKLKATRQCVDMRHAEWIAGAFERTAAYYAELKEQNKPLPQIVFDYDK